jgi:hypothetical protein
VSIHNDKPVKSRSADSRSADEIRQDIERKRRAIASTVMQLDSRLHRLLDWRAQVSRNPLAAAGIAAAVGAAAGVMVAKPRRPVERVADSIAQRVGELRGALGRSLEPVELAQGAPRRRVHRGRSMAATALAVIIERATADFLREKVKQSRSGNVKNTD